MTEELINSINKFLLKCGTENTVKIYNAWIRESGYHPVDGEEVCMLLNYIHTMKDIDHDIIRQFL